MSAPGVKSLRRKHRNARGLGDGVGGSSSLSVIPDKKLRGALKKGEQLDRDAVERAAGVEYWLNTQQGGELVPENDLEKTWRLKQDDVADLVEVGAAAKRFDLTLKGLGPYTCNYSRDGRWLLLGGRKGHVAMVDWSRHKVRRSGYSPNVSEEEGKRWENTARSFCAKRFVCVCVCFLFENFLFLSF